MIIRPGKILWSYDCEYHFYDIRKNYASVAQIFFNSSVEY